MPDYIDIHSHVNFNAFNEDRDSVVQRALEKNTWMFNVGTQKDTSRSAVELAEKYERGVYAIIGLHPVHTDKSYHDVKELGEGGAEFTSRGEQFDKAEYRELAKHPKVVALGECGLDYFHLDAETQKKQKAAFIEQIELANEIGKPLMLHIRNNKPAKGEKIPDGNNAYQDALDILKTYAKVKGDVHFFAGSWEEAKAFLDFGFTLSFTGVITFARDYDEVVRNTPLDMIMAETDCPYVSPAPYRGKRNEPLYVQEIVKKIAEIKGLPLETVQQQLVQNAKRLFNLKI